MMRRKTRRRVWSMWGAAAWQLMPMWTDRYHGDAGIGLLHAGSCCEGLEEVLCGGTESNDALQCAGTLGEMPGEHRRLTGTNLEET